MVTYDIVQKHCFLPLVAWLHITWLCQNTLLAELNCDCDPFQFWCNFQFSCNALLPRDALSQCFAIIGKYFSVIHVYNVAITCTMNLGIPTFICSACISHAFFHQGLCILTFGGFNVGHNASKLCFIQMQWPCTYLWNQ